MKIENLIAALGILLIVVGLFIKVNWVKMTLVIVGAVFFAGSMIIEQARDKNKNKVKQKII